MAISALNSEAGASRAERSGAGAAVRRRSTRAYYEEHADDYAAATMAIDTTDRIAWFAALLPADGRVLDAGCGAGRDLIGLRTTGLRPEGLEISPRLAAIARRNARVPVTVGDLRNPPFAPASFDGIWAMASLLHIELDEIDGTLGALRDLLVPGGVLFASVKRGQGLVRDDTERWFTLHNEASWSRYLQEAGFEVIEIFGEPPTIGAIGTVAPGWVSSLARRPA